MPDFLRQRIFSEQCLDELVDFCCGEHPWEEMQERWIKEKALETIRKYHNQVWLYYNNNDDLVGFGSLGTTSRPYPPPSGNRIKLAIIPSVAVQIRFKGQPVNDPPKYSHQIILSLLNLAKTYDDVNLLTLDVHKDNTRAIKFYKRFGFVPQGDIHNDHIKMFIRLR
jgi:GNAT superfamily N-acetyltransferase